jgi:hypothetical protein
VTESLGMARAITSQNIVLSWLAMWVVALVPLILRRDEVAALSKRIIRRVGEVYSRLSLWQRFLSASVLAILSLLTLQSLLFPSNNVDTMVYHLPRIVSWISQGSLEHFPTHVYRQLYQPPFSEIMIMNVNLLHSGDLFTSVVQVFFFVSSLVVIDLLIEGLGLPKDYRLAGLVLAVTLPAAVLQASSAKGDIVLSFLLLSAAYFAWQVVSSRDWHVFIFLGLSMGLAVLTRGTAYLYIAPIAAVLAFHGMRSLFKGDLTILVRASLSLLIFLLLNAGHYSRNFRLVGNPLLDSKESRMYAYTHMSPTLFVSNVLRNTARQVGPYPVNKYFYNAVVDFHEKIGLALEDSTTVFYSTGSMLKFTSAPTQLNNENTTPNFIHFYVILLAIASTLAASFTGRQRFHRTAVVAALVTVLQLVLFSLYLKWQPWHTRVLVPVFTLAVPMVCHALWSIGVPRLATRSLLVVCLALAFSLAVCNVARPLLPNRYTASLDLRDDRFEKYFPKMPESHLEYRAVRDLLDAGKHRRIGIIDPMEAIMMYPLLDDVYRRPVEPVHVRVRNQTMSIARDSANLDCIITSEINLPQLEVGGKVFSNKTRSNGKLWFYE